MYKEAVSPGTGSLHPGLKMGTGEFNAAGNPAMEQEGSRNVLSRFMLQKSGISAGLMGHVTRMQPVFLSPGTQFISSFTYFSSN